MAKRLKYEDVKEEVEATLKEIKVDTCSNCHPFYTGKQRYVQADGRIDKFNRKYGLNEKK